MQFLTTNISTAEFSSKIFKQKSTLLFFSRAWKIKFKSSLKKEFGDEKSPKQKFNKLRNNTINTNQAATNKQPNNSNTR